MKNIFTISFLLLILIFSGCRDPKGQFEKSNNHKVDTLLNNFVSALKDSTSSFEHLYEVALPLAKCLNDSVSMSEHVNVRVRCRMLSWYVFNEVDSMLDYIDYSDDDQLQVDELYNLLFNSLNRWNCHNLPGTDVYYTEISVRTAKGTQYEQEDHIDISFTKFEEDQEDENFIVITFPSSADSMHSIVFFNRDENLRIVDNSEGFIPEGVVEENGRFSFYFGKDAVSKLFEYEMMMISYKSKYEPTEGYSGVELFVMNLTYFRDAVACSGK